jgi:flagellin-specific chaperone FliS
MDHSQLTQRIARATPVELVVIAYEIAVESLRAGLHYDGEEAGRDAFDAHMNKAVEALTQLLCGLNYEVAFAWELFDIYVYAIQLITRAKVKASAALAREAYDLLYPLYSAFKSTPAAEEAAPVYAGLTYAKDGLSEYIAQDENRGYKA